MDPIEEGIRVLIAAKSETPNRDYKESLTWSRATRDACLEIIKDILAMVNTRDGGKIIFGVRDSDFEFVGMSQADYDSFDVTSVNQLLHQYADPVFTCNLVKRVIDNNRVVVIDVPEFTEVPIVCKESANNSHNHEVLKKGGLYIRTARCTSELVSSAEEMRSILGIGLTRKSEEMLDNIRRLLVGQPISTSDTDAEKYSLEIEEAKVFFESKLPNINAGYWEVVAYPANYQSDRIANPIEAGNLVDSSVVHLRGWDFPHVDSHGNLTNFQNGKQSFTVLDNMLHHKEAWRMYKSGLFVWKEYFVEDLDQIEDENHKVLSFIGGIYSITEFMLFFKRTYQEKLGVGAIHITIKLKDCNGRKLVSMYPGIGLHEYISSEDIIIIEKDIQTVDLQASFESIARAFINDLFILFNWNDAGPSMIENWQKKLIERGG